MFKYHYLEKILLRSKELEDSMSVSSGNNEEFVKISKEYSDLKPIVDNINAYNSNKKEYEELQLLLQEDDDEIVEIAKKEINLCKEKLIESESILKISLVPKDPLDEKNVIVEIRAGTGGDEAALFAGDLLRMYQRYAETEKWKLELLSTSDADHGGIKEAICKISGNKVYSKLKFESGVHRVQRVPETESQGRIHTSAASVVVLPEADDVDIHIEEKDLRIDVFRSSGPGGQSVNTTDSAVRITHAPSGIVVTQQDEKSQHKNKAKAMLVLKSRLYDFERNKQDSEMSEKRKSQIGSGDRSERIRTYNFPQGRVTDHRINLTLYKLDQILNANGIEEIITGLIIASQNQ